MCVHLLMCMTDYTHFVVMSSGLFTLCCMRCEMKLFIHFSRTVITVLELLAAVCLVRGGHEKIMTAVDNFKVVGMQPILQHSVL